MTSQKTLRIGFHKATKRPRPIQLLATTHVERQANKRSESIARAQRRADRKAARR